MRDPRLVPPRSAPTPDRAGPARRFLLLSSPSDAGAHSERFLLLSAKGIHPGARAALLAVIQERPPMPSQHSRKRFLLLSRCGALPRACPAIGRCSDHIGAATTPNRSGPQERRALLAVIRHRVRVLRGSCCYPEGGADGRRLAWKQFVRWKLRMRGACFVSTGCKVSTISVLAPRASCCYPEAGAVRRACAASAGAHARGEAGLARSPYSPLGPIAAQPAPREPRPPGLGRPRRRLVSRGRTCSRPARRR
jgi:hypothetical protein